MAAGDSRLEHVNGKRLVEIRKAQNKADHKKIWIRYICWTHFKKWVTDEICRIFWQIYDEVWIFCPWFVWQG